MLEAKSGEEEARARGRDPSLLQGKAVGAHDAGNVDPGIVRREPGAPHDDGRLDHLSAAHGQTVALQLHAPYARDAGVAQCALGSADQRVATAAKAGPHATPDARFRGRVAHDRPQPVEHVAREQPSRDMSGISSGQPHFSARRELESDLRARVARTNDEHRTTRKVERIAIRTRMQLMNGRRQPTRNRRNSRTLKRPGGDDDAVRLHGTRAAVDADDVSLAVPRQSARTSLQTHRQIVALGVPLQVVRYLILVREVAWRCRERRPRKPAVAGRREESERVPAFAPIVADTGLIAQDDEVDIVTREMISNREARLPAADHHGLETLDASWSR